MTDKVLLGMGNPLLDISAECDQKFLEKYELKLDNAVLAEDKHKPIYDDMIKNLTVDYIAGGATQNSIRVAQWILKKTNSTSFVGCVGKDEFAEQLKKSAEADGVNVDYLVDEETPTGTCAVLIKDGERSLCANLAAANNYKIAHIEANKLHEKATHVYSAGFFLTVSPETLNMVGKHCQDNKKVFMMNLSAPFIVQFFGEKLMKGLEYADFVFGNESEAQAYGDANDLKGKSIAEIAVALQLKVKGGEGTVVITQGADPTIVVNKDGKTTEYPTAPLKKEDIVDSNGAGDSFVGGFAAGLMSDLSIPKCVELGQIAAGQVLGVSGCDLAACGDFKGKLA